MSEVRALYQVKSQVQKCSRAACNSRERGTWTGGSEMHDQSTRTCGRCGVEFRRNSHGRIPKHDAQRYCSRQCYFDTIKAGPKAEPERILPTCAICGQQFDGKASGRYCSRECRLEKGRRDSHERYRQEHTLARPDVTKTCEQCGNSFTVNKYADRLFCSDRCSHNASKAMARAKAHDVPRVQVRRAAIYERDHGLCGICGKAVDRSLPPLHPMSFTLDHIIPLTKGGEHSAANVQVAHRVCNSRKGDKVTA
jgi:hypothetical protein